MKVVPWLGGGPDLEPAGGRRELVGHVPLARHPSGVAGVVAGPVVGHGEPQGSVLRLMTDVRPRCLSVLSRSPEGDMGVRH
jgi:hypothetical protein